MFRLVLHDGIRLPEGVHLERVETRHAEALFTLVEAQRTELEAWDVWAARVPSFVGFAVWLHELRLADARNEAVTCGMWSGDEPLGMVGLGEIDAWNLTATLWTFVRSIVATARTWQGRVSLDR